MRCAPERYQQILDELAARATALAECSDEPPASDVAAWVAMLAEATLLRAGDFAAPIEPDFEHVLSDLHWRMFQHCLAEREAIGVNKH